MHYRISFINIIIKLKLTLACVAFKDTMPQKNTWTSLLRRRCNTFKLDIRGKYFESPLSHGS
jgi:hypothetical protein